MQISIMTRDDRFQKLQASMIKRWGVIDWDSFYPWWRKPVEIRILIYTDGGFEIKRGMPRELTYVSQLLSLRAYPTVSFKLSFAHRDVCDLPASISKPKKLTELDILKNYDEIWLFGKTSCPRLTDEELRLIKEFMSAPKFGGILTTGDHEDVGRGITGNIIRAGLMRRHPGPPVYRPGFHTTLRDGPDQDNQFNNDDQSDDIPQKIRYRQYRLWSPPGFRPRFRPHPVFRGPDGPIDVLPDHKHEGEAIAPAITPEDEAWPTIYGRQEKPEIIAWGLIVDPEADKYGQEIGLISAYDGFKADVGRILADSSWHHWIDTNLVGIHADPPYAGFDATPTGQAALKKIDAFFLNCGVWLAPPIKQEEMSLATWWSILWTDEIMELSETTPIVQMGETAIKALIRRGPFRSATEFILPHLSSAGKNLITVHNQGDQQDRFLDLPFELFLAGGILRALLQEVGSFNREAQFPATAPSDDVLKRAIAKGVAQGFLALTQQIEKEAQTSLSLAASIASVLEAR